MAFLSETPASTVDIMGNFGALFADVGVKKVRELSREYCRISCADQRWEEGSSKPGEKLPLGTRNAQMVSGIHAATQTLHGTP